MKFGVEEIVIGIGLIAIAYYAVKSGSAAGVNNTALGSAAKWVSDEYNALGSDAQSVFPDDGTSGMFE
jgi:hypothetical protein